MPGDQITGEARYYYINNNNTGSGNLLDAVAASFAGALSNGQVNAVGKNQSSVVEVVLNLVNGDLGNFLNGRHGSCNVPKAYLNMVFLDEQFNFIAPDPVTITVGSKADRVSSANNPTTARVNIQNQIAPKNGWVFIFLSNESDEPVYFDDLRVHTFHGMIAEENPYYPYGQKIAGISSRAANKLENNYNFQGDFAEHEEETGWDEFASPYIGMGNNPISSIDPDGGSVGGWGALVGAIAGGVAGYAIAENNGWKLPGLYAALGAVIGAGLGYASMESLFGSQSGPFWSSFQGLL